MNSSYVVRKERCPECKKLGKDTSQDNLAVYSDGHKWCYSCKYTEFPSQIEFFKRKQEINTEVDTKLPFLPLDCDVNYPLRALSWVKQYELTKEDLYKHSVLWSESTQRLLFPIFGDGHLIAFQGRDFSFHMDKPKWFGRGNLKDTFNILGTGNKLVLTEDIISAIKVSKCGVMAMPIYGCVIGRERFKRLYKLIDSNTEVLIWLDPDKRTEATKEAKLGQLCGINTRTVFSDKDPKEHSFVSIKEILNIS